MKKKATPTNESNVFFIDFNSDTNFNGCASEKNENYEAYTK